MEEEEGAGSGRVSADRDPWWSLSVKTDIEADVSVIMFEPDSAEKLKTNSIGLGMCFASSCNST